MSEEKELFSEELFKNICVGFSLANWMHYTFILGWMEYNPANITKGKTILMDKGFMKFFAAVYKEIFSLNPPKIFMKGLFGQMEFFLQACRKYIFGKALLSHSPIILLAVIYFFYFRKK